MTYLQLIENQRVKMQALSSKDSPPVQEATEKVTDFFYNEKTL
jgi:hypothetical protein